VWKMNLRGTRKEIMKIFEIKMILRGVGYG
jgi:hypothetical protein